MRELLEKLVGRYGAGCAITIDYGSRTDGVFTAGWVVAIPDKEIDYNWDFYEYKSESDMIAGANHLIAKPRQDGSK